MPNPARLSERRETLTKLERWNSEQRRLIALIADVDLVVLGAAIDCFESLENAGRFLVTPAPGLGGRVPVDVASSTDGKTEVLQLIGSIEDGGFL